MTSDEIIGFKKSSKINGLKLDETCRTSNSYFNSRVLIFCEDFVKVDYIHINMYLPKLIFCFLLILFLLTQASLFSTSRFSSAIPCRQPSHTRHLQDRYTLPQP